MSESKSIFLADNPNIKNDAFKVHSNIADTLFDIITKYNVIENSFTIGLFGEWGSGKSFIINKLSNKIKTETSNVTFINIDVWKYTGYPLLRSILFELDKQFKEFYKENPEKYKFFKNGYKNKEGKSLQDILYYDEVFESESKLTFTDFKKKLSEIWKTYKIPYIILIGLFIAFIVFQFIPEEVMQNEYAKKVYEVIKVLAPLSSFIGIGGLLLFLFKKPFEKIAELIFFRNTIKNFTEKANFSPEQFENIFKDMLSKIKDEKYVIVFDNIDRCEPKVAYETLSTIKTFMDIENSFYIIPADDDAIKNYLANSTLKQNEEDTFERKFAEEFIDKIFQTYIRIPILKEVERDKYIKEQLKKIDFQKELSEEDIETITQILYFAYKGESPRNIIRFINDYSVYFQLALKSLPRLLDNLKLFTIMIAIKQKWNYFEKILLKYPDFFSQFPANINLIDSLKDKHKNVKELKQFLHSIQDYYLPDIKNCSIDEYIYFKESEKSIEISEALKNNQPEKIKLNEENVKILKQEFKKLNTRKAQFQINSIVAFANLIIKEDKNKLIDGLIVEFWLGFIKIPLNKLKWALKALLKNELLIDLFNTLNNKKVKAYKNKIEEIFVKFFKEPIQSEQAHEVYEKVFAALLDSNYKFSPDQIKEIFSQWDKNNQYLNTLLQIISSKEKKEYLPDCVLKKLIDSIDPDSIKILQNWNRKSIPNDIGKTLFNKIKNRIKNRNFGNYHQLVSKETFLKDDRRLLTLLNKSFIDETEKDEFLNKLTELDYKIFRLANNKQSILELGIEFWMETSYFSELNPNLIDDKLSAIFNQYIKSNSTTLKLMLDNIKYPENILSLPKTKQNIFNTSKELQLKLYEDLNKEYFQNYDLIISYPVNEGHIDVLLQYVKDNKINLDINELSKYLLEKIIYEYVTEKIDVSEKLRYLHEKFDLSSHKQLIIDYKNGIVDFIKENPEESFDSLVEIKNILTYSEFFNNILRPIFTFIKAEMEQGEDVSNYYKLASLIEPTNNKENLKLLFTISKYCLEKSQNLDENYLGLLIVKNIYNNLTKENKEIIKRLILENDNFEIWEKEYYEFLTELKIIDIK